MPEATGAIVLNCLEQGGNREKVEQYLSRFARKISRDQIPTLLASTPVILSHHAPVSVARTVIRTLQDLGASAIFVPSRNGHAGKQISSLLPLLYRPDALAALTSGFLGMAQNGKPGVVMITSCRRGEGKSTVTLNLARGLAAVAGLKVLLIDANGDAPCLHRVLAMQASPGLTDLLAGGASLGEILRYARNYRFFWIAFGSQKYGRLAPFTGPRNRALCRFVAALRSKFDYILIDSPALAGPSDPLLLAGAADGCVLVVACEQTPPEMVRVAEEKLQQGRVHSLGVVLNRQLNNQPAFLE